MASEDRLPLQPHTSQPPLPALEVVKSFLASYFGDADNMNEPYEEIKKQIARNPIKVAQIRDALEEVTAQPQSAGTLSELVALYASLQIPNPADDGARLWLIDVKNNIEKLLPEPGN
jgi:hypothetical protein